MNLRVTFSCGWSNVGVVGGLVLLSLGLIWGTNFFYIWSSSLRKFGDRESIAIHKPVIFCTHTLSWNIKVYFGERKI